MTPGVEILVLGCGHISHLGENTFLYPPQTKLPGYIVILMSVRSFIRSFVSSFVHPSPSLIRYSSKTAEQNFMKLSGIVHYMMHTAPPILNFYPHDFGVSQS